MTDYFTDDEITGLDVSPIISKTYYNISDEYKINNLEVGLLGTKTMEVWDILKHNFELFYWDREIAGESEYDFFCMMQYCLNKNADTIERLLSVYEDDIANPVLGRKEVVTYNLSTTDDRSGTSEGSISSGMEDSETVTDINHHVEVPANAPAYDTDRTRDKLEHSGSSASESSQSSTGTTTDNRRGTQKGTVTTQLSDIGVRPNYETLNGFLDNNRTFIQVFNSFFKDCFVPNYRRVLI